MDFEQERERMIKDQIIRRGIVEPRLITVLSSVPRHLFVTSENVPYAYEDHPLQIGANQTISQPFIVALMTSLLALQGKENVLEIGTGSGYQAAILGRMAGSVHTVELIASLGERARKILENLGFNNVVVHIGDGSEGWKDAAPYDAIVVTAAAPDVPAPLLQQLADGGRMVIPVGDRYAQELQVWERSGNRFDHEPSIPVVFVPLRGTYGWRDYQ